MNYEQFHAVWRETLDEAGLLSATAWSTETVDLRWPSRTYSIRVSPVSVRHTELFYVSAELGWRWDAILAARMATTEEDLLMELFGRGGYYLNTEQPWLRASVTLSATLPHDEPIPLPAPDAWRRWAATVMERLTPLLPITSEEDEHGLIVRSSRSEPEAKLRCAPDGQLFLAGVELAAWQSIDLPRQWDNPDREWDADPDEQLADLFSRVGQALREWVGCLRHLASR